MESATFAVLTVSDTCFQDPSKDRSGPRLVQLIKSEFQDVQIITDIRPDEHSQIQNKLLEWIAQDDIRVIITTGGTGFAPRDVTPEATKTLIEKDCAQLTLAIALASLKKNKFAALSRGVCGIAHNTLVMNFPGSEKAVIECFEAIHDLLPHALNLISNDIKLVQRTHAQVQGRPVHQCPHKTGKGDGQDRNSPFAMIPVNEAQPIIFSVIPQFTQHKNTLESLLSPINIPPFRASIKDGYAMKSTGFSGSKRVLQCIAAGDVPNPHPLQEDECFKINTGAPLPDDADCVVQVEDTKLLQCDKYGEESLVEILVEPQANMDVRAVGHDLSKGDKLFPQSDMSPVVVNSIMASVGLRAQDNKIKIAIISTGSELLEPLSAPEPGKIYDSNTTMLQELLNYFGFHTTEIIRVKDDYETTKKTLENLFEKVNIVICSGGISMGDKDFIKPALKELDFKIHFGRVNMKPGKPTTFASNNNKYFFGLPGNPVSAFVTFHLFALPAIRWANGWKREKCLLPVINVKLLNDSIELDPRPEYVRASVISRNGELYASINGDQISSRLQSIVGADVLVQLPSRSENKTHAIGGQIYPALVLRNDFISKYE